MKILNERTILLVGRVAELKIGEQSDNGEKSRIRIQPWLKFTAKNQPRPPMPGPGKPYKAGQSGNPSGKPKGATDKRTALRALLEPHAQELVTKAIELAKSGDTTALRLCLERLIPPVKARDEPVELETAGGTLTEQGRGVLKAIACGRITPQEAATVMQALSAQARVVEAEELLKRVEALEQALERRTDGTAHRTHYPA